ncbi:serine/threonine/tyrosine-interacting-like protein 1 isoform X2 [Octopus bimaculoides]|uniref:Tyrosine-protein phosphatase domain-containing protein n=1 Tax=Octopus bimaculoides TaxID=37653 RepID=A0A0L8H892_OCTBM|nr:serine/threonine/tyrosine-interacting-like protein 1 isoform X2 [Octopus bimaculoides]|eukprot:XP_014774591.1 PREDICTED: serine/threonine/tyrosine-interacting-like protein 1 isoform X2 [Octopus bimaculoides]
MENSLVFLDHSEFYNLLQKCKRYPALADPNYLLLLDTRKEDDYHENHIITARRIKEDETLKMLIPYDAELECKQYVVVYDSNTSSLSEKGPFLDFALLLWKTGSKYKVKILKGGYEDFSAHYPFLRSKKIMFTQRELDTLQLYPYEIIPKKLYLSKNSLASQPYVIKDLKLTAFLNCTEDVLPMPQIQHVYHVPETDSDTTNLYKYFQECCEFIDVNETILAFSVLGISRSTTILVAYIMYSRKVSLGEAYNFIQKCCYFIRPNRNFIHQLSAWEGHLFNGTVKTNIEDPYF